VVFAIVFGTKNYLYSQYHIGLNGEKMKQCWFCGTTIGSLENHCTYCDRKQPVQVPYFPYFEFFKVRGENE